MCYNFDMIALSAVSMPIVYHIFAAGIYGCILVICLLALVYGRRARRNVKKEKVTRMPQGFSPLDVKRIFIGKTFPRRMTRALIAYWAQCGYISVKYVSKFRVQITKLKSMPSHSASGAIFFDRGTYVRERDLFWYMTDKAKSGKAFNLLRPMFTKDEIKRINSKYAAREDEGVYTARHYRLKLITLALSLLPFALAVVWLCVSTGNFVSLILVGTAIIGLFVFMFVRDMPIVFKLIWCGMWLGVSIGAVCAFYVGADIYNPLHVQYAAVGIFFIGSLFLIRFVDYREKNNLAEYSDLINYRKYLLFTPKQELEKEDYYAVLPFLYAFGIKQIAKRKFRKASPPDWYKGDAEGKGALL